MKTSLLILLALCATLSLADLITDWNETALAAIKTDNTPPPKAARALAILHTAIYAAVNGIAQTHERYLVSGKPAGISSPEAAVSAAAHLVLVRLFPAQQTALDAAHNKALAAIANSAEKNNGVHWGEWAANILRPQHLQQRRPFDSAQGTRATVLAAFFGSDEIAFSTTSDAMPGFSRTFHSLSEAAAEAGISRVFGGIHFMWAAPRLPPRARGATTEAPDKARRQFALLLLAQQVASHCQQ